MCVLSDDEGAATIDLGLGKQCHGIPSALGLPSLGSPMVWLPRWVGIQGWGGGVMFWREEDGFPMIRCAGVLRPQKLWVCRSKTKRRCIHFCCPASESINAPTKTFSYHVEA